MNGEKPQQPNNIVSLTERIRERHNEKRKAGLETTPDGNLIFSETARKMVLTMAEVRKIAQEILNSYVPFERLVLARNEWELVKHNMPEELLLKVPEAISQASVMESLNSYREQCQFLSDERVRELIEEHQLKRIQFDPVYLYAMAEKLAGKVVSKS